MKKNEDQKKTLNEYRIIYNAGEDHAAMDSKHYYQAYSAEEALSFHNEMMSKKHFKSQLVGIEKYCPYAQKWTQEHLPD